MDYINNGDTAAPSIVTTPTAMSFPAGYTYSCRIDITGYSWFDIEVPADTAATYTSEQVTDHTNLWNIDITLSSPISEEGFVFILALYTAAGSSSRYSYLARVETGSHAVVLGTVEDYKLDRLHSTAVQRLQYENAATFATHTDAAGIEAVIASDIDARNFKNISVQLFGSPDYSSTVKLAGFSKSNYAETTIFGGQHSVMSDAAGTVSIVYSGQDYTLTAATGSIIDPSSDFTIELVGADYAEYDGTYTAGGVVSDANITLFQITDSNTAAVALKLAQVNGYLTLYCYDSTGTLVWTGQASTQSPFNSHGYANTHYAIVQAGDVLSVYHQGYLVAETTVTWTWSAKKYLTTGKISQYDSSLSVKRFELNDCRITAAARYHTEFSPPTKVGWFETLRTDPFGTAQTGPASYTDGSFYGYSGNNVNKLVFDPKSLSSFPTGSEQLTSITDALGQTWSAYNGAVFCKKTTSGQKYAGSAWVVDLTSSTSAYAYSSTYFASKFDSGVKTLELAAYFTSVSDGFIFGDSSALSIKLLNSKLVVTIGGVVWTSSDSLVASKWYAIALSDVDGETAIFINGRKAAGTKSSTAEFLMQNAITLSSWRPSVGCNDGSMSSAVAYVTGVKATARTRYYRNYTATPYAKTSELPNARNISAYADSVYKPTIDDVGATTLANSGTNTNAMTLYGGASIDTTRVDEKGSPRINLTASGSYASFSLPNPDLFSADFTIELEFEIYPQSSSTNSSAPGKFFSIMLDGVRVINLLFANQSGAFGEDVSGVVADSFWAYNSGSNCPIYAKQKNILLIQVSQDSTTTQTYRFILNDRLLDVVTGLTTYANTSTSQPVVSIGTLDASNPVSMSVFGARVYSTALWLSNSNDQPPIRLATESELSTQYLNQTVQSADPYYRNVIFLFQGDGNTGVGADVSKYRATPTLYPSGYSLSYSTSYASGDYASWANAITSSAYDVTSYNLAWPSLYFSGGGQAATWTSKGFSGDFTIEFSVCPAELTYDVPLLTLSTAAGVAKVMIALTKTGDLVMVNYDYDWALQVKCDGLLTVGAWSNVILSRIGSRMYAYINGRLQGVYAISSSMDFAGSYYTAGTPLYLTVGREYPGGTYGKYGYLNSVTTSGGDDYYNNVAMLLHFNSSAYADSGPKNSNTSLATATNVQYLTPSKFGTKALHLPGDLDGSSAVSYASIDSPGSHFDVGTGDFTVEFWLNTFYNNSTDTVLMTGAQTTAASGIPYIGHNSSGQLIFSPGTTASKSTFTTVSLTGGKWQHVEFSRVSGTVYAFIDGALAGSVACTVSLNFASSSKVMIGNHHFTDIVSTGYNGLIDSIRFTNGVGRHSAAFTAPTSSFSTLLTTDTYASYVQLCVDFSTMTDYSQNSLTVTLNGSAASMAINKFGSGCLYLDGANYGYLKYTNDALAMFTGDVTVELWALRYGPPGSAPNASYESVLQVGESAERIEVRYGDAGFSYGLHANLAAGGSTAVVAYPYGGSGNSSGSYDKSWRNKWMHIAICRINGVWSIYVDGVAGRNTVSSTFSLIDKTLYIGRGGSSTAAYVLVDELRITAYKGRYYKSFSVPTAAYVDYASYTETAYEVTQASNYFHGSLDLIRITDGVGRVSGYADTEDTSYDPIFKEVALMLHFEGSSVVDSSINGLTLLANGSPALSTSIYAIGSSSLYLNGSSWYTIPDSELFNFSSNDFSIEAKIYPTQVSTEMMFFSQRSNAGNSTPIMVGVRSGYLYVAGALSTDGGSSWSINSSFTVGNIAIAANTWYDIKVIRSGTTITTYVDGVADQTFTVGTSALRNSTDQVTIGAGVQTGANPWQGYLDELRITNGTARSTTVSTTKFKDKPATAKRTKVFTDYELDNIVYSEHLDAYYDNVAMLIHGEGVPTTTSVYDQTGNFTITNGLYAASPVVLGASCLSAMGTAKPTATATTAVSVGSSPFTFEFWINVPRLPGVALVTQRSGYGYCAFEMLVNSSGHFYMLIGNATATSWVVANSVFSDLTYTAGTWAHVALVGDGTSMYLYVNGVRSSTVMKYAGLAPISQFIFGKSSDGTTSGYYDEIRFTAGVARYTTLTFTPSTHRFGQNTTEDVYNTNTTYGAAANLLTSGPLLLSTQTNPYPLEGVLYDTSDVVVDYTDPTPEFSGLTNDVFDFIDGYSASITVTNAPYLEAALSNDIFASMTITQDSSTSSLFHLSATSPNSFWYQDSGYTWPSEHVRAVEANVTVTLYAYFDDTKAVLLKTHTFVIWKNDLRSLETQDCYIDKHIGDVSARFSAANYSTEIGASQLVGLRDSITGKRFKTFAGASNTIITGATGFYSDMQAYVSGIELGDNYLVAQAESGTTRQNPYLTVGNSSGQVSMVIVVRFVDGTETEPARLYLTGSDSSSGSHSIMFESTTSGYAQASVIDSDGTTHTFALQLPTYLGMVIGITIDSTALQLYVNGELAETLSGTFTFNQLNLAYIGGTPYQQTVLTTTTHAFFDIVFFSKVLSSTNMSRYYRYLKNTYWHVTDITIGDLSPLTCTLGEVYTGNFALSNKVDALYWFTPYVTLGETGLDAGTTTLTLTELSTGSVPTFTLSGRIDLDQTTYANYLNTHTNYRYLSVNLTFYNNIIDRYDDVAQLYLPGDGVYGTSSIYDFSTSMVTPSSSAGSAISYYGDCLWPVAGSLLFEPTISYAPITYASSSQWDITQDDFEVSFWFRIANVVNGTPISPIKFYDADNPDTVYWSFEVRYTSSGATAPSLHVRYKPDSATSASSLFIGTIYSDGKGWNHAQLSCRDGVWMFYVNKSLVGSITAPTDMWSGNKALDIGQAMTSSGTYLQDGTRLELRDLLITPFSTVVPYASTCTVYDYPIRDKGYLRRNTTMFAEPDAYADRVVFSGRLNLISPDASNERALTTSANVSLDNAGFFPKYELFDYRGRAAPDSWYFNGNAYFAYPLSTDFQVFAEDFTIEISFKAEEIATAPGANATSPNTYAGSRGCLFELGNSLASRACLYLKYSTSTSSAELRYYSSRAGTASDTYVRTISTGVCYRLRLFYDYSTQTVSIYYGEENGYSALTIVEITDSTSPYQVSTMALAIGHQPFDPDTGTYNANTYASDYFKGWITNFRITACLREQYWKAPARKPFGYPGAVSASTDLVFEQRIGDVFYYSQLLNLSLYGQTVGDTTINDVSLWGRSISSTATVSSDKTPFGQKTNIVSADRSLYFNGTDSMLQTSSTVYNCLESDHTFEFWVYPMASKTIQTLFEIGDNTNAWTFFLDGTTLKMSTNLYTAADLELTTLSSSGAVPRSAWTHIAISKNGISHGRVYINGKRVSSFEASPFTVNTVNVPDGPTITIGSAELNYYTGNATYPDASDVGPFYGYMAGFTFYNTAKYFTDFHLPTYPTAGSELPSIYYGIADRTFHLAVTSLNATYGDLSNNWGVINTTFSADVVIENATDVAVNNIGGYANVNLWGVTVKDADTATYTVAGPNIMTPTRFTVELIANTDSGGSGGSDF